MTLARRVDAMRKILVVDGSELMAWLVGNLAPAGVEVVHARSLADAETILRHDSPQAAIFNITPSRLNWQLLHELCHARTPPIPHIWCATVEPDEETERTLPCDRGNLIGKPFHIEELRARINELFGVTEQATTSSSEIGEPTDPRKSKPLP